MEYRGGGGGGGGGEVKGGEGEKDKEGEGKLINNFKVIMITISRKRNFSNNLGYN